MKGIVLFALLSAARATSIHNIHWNATNPIFRRDNIIEINSGNHPWEYDQVNIVCPIYKPGMAPDHHEQYVIYSVSKEEFDSCRITQANPKIIALCNRPYEMMYFTITFRSFTPTPGGLEFHPGHDYYFISTSSKGDLHRRVGGSCSTHNMKVVFKVAPNSSPDSELANLVEDDPIVADEPEIVFAPPVFRHPQSEGFRFFPLREVARFDDHRSESLIHRGGRSSSAGSLVPSCVIAITVVIMSCWSRRNDP